MQGAAFCQLKECFSTFCDRQLRERSVMHVLEAGYAQTVGMDLCVVVFMQGCARRGVLVPGISLPGWETCKHVLTFGGQNYVTPSC